MSHPPALYPCIDPVLSHCPRLGKPPASVAPWRLGMIPAHAGSLSLAAVAARLIASLKHLVLVLMTMMTHSGNPAAAEGGVLDPFEDLAGWSASASPGVQVELARADGLDGPGMRIDFDFRGGGGYLIARKAFAIPLPDNYRFSLRLRGEAPANNLEFKVIDGTGANVWWQVQRDYAFPKEWQRIMVKKRHLQFAWGPQGGGVPAEMGTLELAISAGSGGKGSVWIDDLRFEPRPPAGPYTQTPQVSASTALGGHEPQRVLDTESAVGWHSGTLAQDQWLLLDFQHIREYGGLIIDWDEDDYATAYQVQISEDGRDWTPAYSVTAGNGRRDYIYLPDAESRYLRLVLQNSSRGQGYGIRALQVRPYEFSASPQDFFTAIARDAPRGRYPRYFYGEQTYWTLVGVDGDKEEGLLNEEGMLEVGKGRFSIEPFIQENGRLLTWHLFATTQELEQGYLPVPSVIWRDKDLALKITAFATGEPGASTLYARYRLENSGAQPRFLTLFLALRPFQVNPPSQSLNMAGGITQIQQLDYRDQQVRVNGKRAVLALTPPDGFGAAPFDKGPIVDYLEKNQLPGETAVSDPFGYASGALRYTLELPPGEFREVYLAVPWHDTELPGRSADAALDGNAFGRQQLESAIRYWERRLDRVVFEVPPAAQPLIDTVKSNLAYILINRDGPAIQPGSRSYDRSWIRDGALTSAALLGMGYTREVRDFLQWYARYQFPDGRIPCCIDRRGADPVVENDSNGQFIYAVMEYYRYTRDVGFLAELWPTVTKAVEHLEQLRRQQLDDVYKNPAVWCYGLLPQSISHEGYSDKPVYSFWDDFFALRGLKDAADMAMVLGDDERARQLAKLRDEFRDDLCLSIDKTMARHGIQYIPGSVEYGDFDPSATTIALSPGGAQRELPQSALHRTFEDYYAHFLKRHNGEIAWDAYTPYEIRIVGSLVRLGRRDTALEVLDFFLKDRRPAAWNHWAEVVWRDARVPRFIGDMPHTWVGSDYIRVVRSLFAYEREEDQALVIAAGLPCAWIEGGGVTLKRLPTYYGTLNYTLRGEADGSLHLRLSGDLTPPPGKIVVRPPLPRPLKNVTVNGKATTTFDADSATIGEFPADVVLHSGAGPLCGDG